MTDTAKKLLALFREHNTGELCWMEYAVIDGYSKAISELEELGYIQSCNDVVGSIALIR